MDGSRSALVVAAHEFADPKFQRLRSPASDVDALAGVLGDPAIGAFDVRTVVNQDSSVVQQELERFFSGRKPDDLLLLYFSCHGVKDPGGRLYFASTNTTFDLLRSTGVSASFVSEQMEYSRSKRIVVLLDCCYSGAFLRGFRARGDDSVAVDQLEGRGRAVITASRATEYAFEADELTAENARPSMFTGALVEGLATGRADVNGDGLVTVDELYDYVYDAVRGKVAGQTPGRWADLEGDLVVARNPVPPVRPAGLPGELQRAMESDAALQRLGAVSELAAWLASGDPARALAAGPLLEQLAADYDDRVRTAAAAALAAGPVIPSAVGAEAGTVPSAVAAEIPAVAAEFPAVAVHAGPPPVTPAPPERPLPAAEPPAPAPGRPARTPGRAMAWLACAGALLVLLSPYVTFIRHTDWTETLSAWFPLGTFGLCAIVGLAATLLLRPVPAPAAGVPLLAGLLPVAAGGLLSVLSNLVHNDSPPARPATGWVLAMAGFALLLVGCLLAARWWSRQVTLAPPSFGRREEAARRRGDVAVLGAAVTVGLAGALGWATAYTLTRNGILDWDPSARALAVRLAVVTVAAAAGWRTLRGLGKLGTVVTIGLYLAMVVILLAGQAARAGDWWWWLTYAVDALGVSAVCAVAAVAVPRRQGALLLAALATATLAFVPGLLSDRDHHPAGLLGAAMVAALALAAAISRRPDPAP